MPNNKDFENVSNNVIDMLLDSTLKKHGVKLEAKKIGEEQKKELRNMVDNLKKSVDQLSQQTKQKKE